ncbi:hypothetical protein [Streptomyces sp. NPDC050546]|uniref:hypothetical protein n=1 Tax=Streptomyces sp. NPDC050546 TaxID=3365628 RepID=UPI0037AA664F
MSTPPPQLPGNATGQQGSSHQQNNGSPSQPSAAGPAGHGNAPLIPGQQPGNPHVWVAPPVDPALEANEISRRSAQEAREIGKGGLRIGRVTAVIGALAVVATTVQTGPAILDYLRERDKDKAEEKVEKGSPVTISSGESYYGPGWFATDSDQGAKHEGALFDQVGTNPDAPSWEWLWTRWSALNSVGTSVNIVGKHKNTVLIQGVEISRLKCSEPARSSLIRNPPIGDGGSFANPAYWAFNVEAVRPVPHALTENDLVGDLKPMDLALEQGDQREVVIRFFASKKSCSFEAHLVISSNGKKYKERLPAPWGSNVFRVTAPPSNLSYANTFVTGDSVMRVPAEAISWDDHNRPEYSGPLG